MSDHEFHVELVRHAETIAPHLKAINDAGCGVIILIGKIERHANGKPKRAHAIATCDFKGQEAAEMVEQLVYQIFPRPIEQSPPNPGDLTMARKRIITRKCVSAVRRVTI